MENKILEQICNCVYEGDDELITDYVHEALQMGIGPRTILEDSLRPAISNVGRKFRDNEVYVPDVILASAAMKAALTIMQPLLSASHYALGRKVLIGSVENDLHDLGKTIVICSLMAAGFEVVDLGIDVSTKQYIDAIEKEKPDILALSCTLSYTLPYMKKTVHSIRQHPVGSNLKIIVGGLAVNPGFAMDSGADAYAINEEHIAQLALRMIQESSV